MSKSATANSVKIPSQFPSKSAWAKGPPTPSASSPRAATTPTSSSPRPSSPAPSNVPTPPASVSHSRRPSTLGQGVAVKEGVSVSQRAANAVNKSSSVTFGSIDDVSAPISSSPAAVPTLKSQGVKTFGTIAAAAAPAPANGRAAAATPPPASTTPSSSSAAKPAAAASKMSKADVLKMFQSSSSPAAPPAETPSSPSRATAAPPTPTTQPSPLAAHSFTPFVPSQGFRGTPTPAPPAAPAAQGAPPPGPNGSASPRAPAFPRQMTNGAPPRAPSTAPGAPGTPQSMASALPSPSLRPVHAMPVQGMPPSMTPGLAPGMPPQGMPMPAWPGYYYQYPGMPPPGAEYMQYSPHWQMQGLPPQHAPGHPPPPGQPGVSPVSPRPGMPQMSPGTPSHGPAPLPPQGWQPPPGQVASPPGGPGANGMQPPPTPGGRMNGSAPAFVPGGAAPRKTVVIRDPSGVALDVGAIAKGGAPVAVPASPVRDPREVKRQSIRIESEDAKRAREQKERAEKEKAERDDRAKKERDERQASERQAKDDAERKAKADAERKAKEDAERQAREEAERKAQEETERTRKEEEEKERVRREKEDAERKAREEEERKAREAEEARKAEEAERTRKEEEERTRAEAERKQREEDEAKAAADAKAKTDADAKAKVDVDAKVKSDADADAAAKAAAPAAPAASSAEKEEGEIDESASAAPADASASAADKPKLADLKINTSNEGLRKRPGRLDLSNTQKGISGSLPSALATARIIEDINQVSYPEGIMSPKIELNINAKDGKFRYDRDFLMQFMSICKEKPDMLPPLDAIGLEPVDPSNFSMQRGGSGRRASTMSRPDMNRQPSVGLGINAPFNRPTMGQFGTGNTAKTSAERFTESQLRTPVTGPGAKFPPGAPMLRTASGSGNDRRGDGRSRSSRGSKRGQNEKPPGGSGFHQPPQQMLIGPDGLPLGPVKPLEKSADAWAPIAKTRAPPVDDDSPQLVDRKVKSLLNKLTMEKFDSISDQIIDWANKSKTQTDGRTLIQVIRLVFEKATDEASWSEMYARLCRKMMEQISTEIQDEGIKNAEGNPIVGGQLFRKYLLNRCQEDFERGWALKDAAASAAAARATEDGAVADANADKKEGDEIALYSEEYYISQKAKRQGLGLVKFIGELFKLQMLTERIMHECVKKLLGNVDNPEEEEIESLCKLLTTVGKLLDTARAGPHMDIYFTRMKELTKNPKVNSRMQFMLVEVIELRERKWVPRNQVAAPATIAQLRKDAAEENIRQSNERAMNMSRGGSRRGGDRGGEGSDGWAVAGNAAPRAPPKAGDLSRFGKIEKPASGAMTFGPSSVFNKKTDPAAKREAATMSRSASTSNAFSLLQSQEMAAEMAGPPASAKGSRPGSRKPSVDFGAGGAPEAGGQRRKLNLLPRTQPAGDKSGGASPDQASTPVEDVEQAPAASMPESEAQRKIAEDMKEFFEIRNVDEGEDYFSKLPAEHRFRLVDKFVTRAIESKQSDAQLVADLFARAVEKNLCPADAFEQGFMPVAEMLDDIAIDAPKAFDLMAIMLKGAGLAGDEERRSRIAEKSMDSDKLLALLA